jgi:uncharacterized membrane protein
MDSRVEGYLGRLNSALRGISAAEKQEILFEIRAHIVDSVTSAPNREAAISRVLRLLGTPEELAQRYHTERLLIRASHSFSPWILLQTTWRWAKLGMKGTLAFFLALFGYGAAFTLTVVVILKPFRKANVGMWWGNDSFIIGAPAHPAGMHELLGQLFVPVMAAFAFALAVGTTHALRWLIRKRSTTSF